MRSIPTFVLSLLLLAPCPAQETLRFRQWVMGEEAGGMEITSRKDAAGELVKDRAWTRLERKLDEDPATPPMVVELHQESECLRRPDGSLHITWSVQISREPLQGRAEWSPKRPGLLQVFPKNGSPQEIPIPEGGVLWPGEADALLREAARSRKAIHLTQFSYAEQQWGQTNAEPAGPDPLPGHPDAIRFEGREQAGPVTSEIRIWISPSAGELKRQSTLAGLVILLQRSELPPPAPVGDRPGGFFQRTLAPLPLHPFLLWLPELDLRWKGAGQQVLPEDPQQKQTGEGRYHLRRAALPTPEEARQPPVRGKALEAEAPFLAPSPLVPFRDPVFDGLIRRLDPPAEATRWQLAKLVTSFVYEWISDKNLAVGYASALEVARHPRGDCTEHGVLAVALLRRLGVPSRCVAGWVGLNGLVGQHYWVEVKLKERWVPVDPTFDQAPASVLRLKMGTTDLADLGSLGWDTRTLSFVDGSWVPEGPWAGALRLDREDVVIPGGERIRIPGVQWTLDEGLLRFWNPEPHELEACVRPGEDQTRESRLLMGLRTRRKGWWRGDKRLFWMDLGDGRWIQIKNCSNSLAFQLLDELEHRGH